jgi:hypothetical protein
MSRRVVETVLIGASASDTNHRSTESQFAEQPVHSLPARLTC